MRLMFAIALVILVSRSVSAQSTAPQYDQCRLDAIYPAGGQAGQTVMVEFQGAQGGLQFPKAMLIDGPPGITAGEIKSLDANRIEVPLTIAADALPGRRAVRVVTEQAGLTNMAWFIVGRLPERNETEPNQELAQAETLNLPLTVNGRIQTAVDVDTYRFTVRAGQNLVAAVMSHALDAHGQGKDAGIVDAQLELLDPDGKVVASAQDSLGLDPVIAYSVPRDGVYSVRIQLMGYRGFPQAVYRLTLGDVPIPYAAFPGGGRRGESVAVQLTGYNAAPGCQQTVNMQHPWSPFTWTTVGGDLDSGRDVPLHIGEGSESTEQEPNQNRSQANELSLSGTMNGRFEAEGDEDWFRLECPTLQPIRLEVFAHRFLKSPLDTVLQVYDAEGKRLLEVDDGDTDPGYEQYHDFRTPDSQLTFTPKTTGTYFVRVTDANGAWGPRTVYRLVYRPAVPDFHLIQFPDAVPIWGAGSTAALLVRIERQLGLDADIELSVEGLSPGWTSSRHTNTWKSPQNISNYSTKQFLTVTAPADATPGAISEFRIVGRAKVGERLIEHTAYPLTLYYTSDTGFFRVSPASRVAVARKQGATLSTDTSDFTMTLGETLKIPVRVADAGDAKEISLTANVCSNGVASNWGSPASITIAEGIATYPLQVPEGATAGNYSLVIARTWRSDIRVGMPGPCTQAIRLTVLPKP